MGLSLRGQVKKLSLVEVRRLHETVTHGRDEYVRGIVRMDGIRNFNHFLSVA
jgi:hypothetical protein